MLLKGAVLLNIQPKFMWAVCDLGMKTHFPMQITSIMCEIMVSMYMCVCVEIFIYLLKELLVFYRKVRYTEGGKTDRRIFCPMIKTTSDSNG